MFTFLIIIIALIGVVMALLVLIQAGKGGGLAGIAAGGATTQILGARQAPDILEKATWTLAVLFIALCILTNFAINPGETQNDVLQGQDQPTAQPVTPPTGTAPAPEQDPTP